jgi:hypothetical protein
MVFFNTLVLSQYFKILSYQTGPDVSTSFLSFLSYYIYSIIYFKLYFINNIFVTKIKFILPLYLIHTIDVFIFYKQ